MSRNRKPRYVLLQFEVDKSTIIKQTDVVEWLDYSKTKGIAVVEGKPYLAEALYFNGMFHFIGINFCEVITRFLYFGTQKWKLLNTKGSFALAA